MSTAPETSIPANEHPTTRERVLAVAAWLVAGKLRYECVDAAMKEWRLNRRMAQYYVARAAYRIAKTTSYKDPAFVLLLSQEQRHRLYQELSQLLRSSDAMPAKVQQLKAETLQTMIKMLNARDRTTVRIAQLSGSLPRRKTLRQAAAARSQKPKRNPKPAPAAPDTMAAALAAVLQEFEQLCPGESGAPD